MLKKVKFDEYFAILSHGFCCRTAPVYMFDVLVSQSMQHEKEVLCCVREEMWLRLKIQILLLTVMITSQFVGVRVSNIGEAISVLFFTKIVLFKFRKCKNEFPEEFHTLLL